MSFTLCIHTHTHTITASASVDRSAPHLTPDPNTEEHALQGSTRRTHWHRATKTAAAAAAAAARVRSRVGRLAREVRILTAAEALEGCLIAPPTISAGIFREGGCARLLEDHTCLVWEDHTCPVLEDYTRPVLEDHTCPVLEDHTCPVLEDHTCPVLKDHTCPVLEDHTCPVTTTAATVRQGRV